MTKVIGVKFKENGDGFINYHTYFNVRGVNYEKDEGGGRLVLLYPIAKSHVIRLNQVDFLCIEEID